MFWLNYLIAAVGGYLIGAFSFARIIIRLFAPESDISNGAKLGLDGSDKEMHLKTVSATTVSVKAGSHYGFMTYVMDVIKIAVPMAVIRSVFPDNNYYLVFAAAGVVGHVWPVYYGFRGGRGISTIYGGVFVIDWIGVFATAIPGMLFGLVVLRDILTAYMAGVILLIPWLWWRTQDVSILIYAIFVNIIFAIAMIPEIKAWLKIRREEKWDDPAEVMQLSGMGRGLLKMAKKFGLIKKRT
jgi:glycerol-3-phosphate acyltransferase PlsY